MGLFDYLIAVGQSTGTLSAGMPGSEVDSGNTTTTGVSDPTGQFNMTGGPKETTSFTGGFPLGIQGSVIMQGAIIAGNIMAQVPPAPPEPIKPPVYVAPPIVQTGTTTTQNGTSTGIGAINSSVPNYSEIIRPGNIGQGQSFWDWMWGYEQATLIPNK